MGARLACRRAKPEVHKERNSLSASFLCLGTFSQGYVWMNKPCLLHPANSDLSCVLPCFRAQLWLYLPAQAHPVRDSACCQLLMLSRGTWPGTQRKGVEEWELEPGSQPSTLSACDWTFEQEQQKVIFSQGKLCHCRLAMAFVACWKEMFCQRASLTPSVQHVEGKESPSRSERVLRGRCSCSDTGWFFPQRLETHIERRSSQNRTSVYLADGNNLASAISQALGEELRTSLWITYILYVLICNCSYSSCYSYHQESVFYLFSSFFMLKS